MALPQFSFSLSSPAAVGAGVLTLVAVASAFAGDSAPLARSAPPDRFERAAALVEEALTREIYGLDDDRDALLAQAEKMAPKAPEAKWRRGMVFVDGKWTGAEEAATKSAEDDLLVAYVAQRDKASDSLEGHVAMADWCHAKRLGAQEKAHLVRVLTFESDHAAARARLGFVRIGDEWVEREEIARGLAEEAKSSIRTKRRLAS